MTVWNKVDYLYGIGECVEINFYFFVIDERKFFFCSIGVGIDLLHCKSENEIV